MHAVVLLGPSDIAGQLEGRPDEGEVDRLGKSATPSVWVQNEPSVDDAVAIALKKIDDRLEILERSSRVW
jgi:hypothetical protein